MEHLSLQHISQIVQWLKGVSSRILLQEIVHLREQYLGRHPIAKVERRVEGEEIERCELYMPQDVTPYSQATGFTHPCYPLSKGDKIQIDP